MIMLTLPADAVVIDSNNILITREDAEKLHECLGIILRPSDPIQRLTSSLEKLGNAFAKAAVKRPEAVLEDIVVSDPEPKCGPRMPCVLVPVLDEDDEWQSRLPHAERVAVESAIPLADEVPHCGCFVCGGLFPPRLLTRNGRCMPCAIKNRDDFTLGSQCDAYSVKAAVTLAETNETKPDPEECNLSQSASQSALEPWEERLLAIYANQLVRCAGLPSHRVIARTYDRCSASLLPQLRRLTSPMIRVELARLGIEIESPGQGKGSRVRAKAEPEPRPPARNSSAILEPEEIAQRLVEFWHKYRPQFAKDTDIIGRIIQVTRAPKWRGIDAKKIRAILAEQGVEVAPPGPPIPPDNRTNESDQEMALRLWETIDQEIPEGRRISNIASRLTACRRAGHNSATVRAILDAAGKLSPPPPPTSSEPVTDALPVQPASEQSNTAQVQKEHEIDSQSNDRQITLTDAEKGPALGECPSDAELCRRQEQKVIDSISDLLGTAPERYAKAEPAVTLQLIKGLAVLEPPLHLAKLMRLDERSVQDFAKANEGWIAEYAKLPPFKRSELDRLMMGKWTVKERAA